MPRPTEPTLAPYTQPLPNVDDPATWPARTRSFWTWVTGAGFENLGKIITFGRGAMDYIDTALAGSETLIDAVNRLNNGYTHGTPTRIATAGAGNYSVPAGARGVLIQAVGGGGGGAGASAASGLARPSGGGSGGAFAEWIVFTPPATIAYNVGAGGASGIGNATAANRGSPGGNTVVGAVTVPGGYGGPANTYFSVPHCSDGGDFTALPSGTGVAFINSRRGNPGGIGIKLSETFRMSGTGGHSPFGTGGPSVTSGQSTVNAAGLGGSGQGSGGGGALSSETAGGTGGSGSAGLVVFVPLF